MYTNRSVFVLQADQAVQQTKGRGLNSLSREITEKEMRDFAQKYQLSARGSEIENRVNTQPLFFAAQPSHMDDTENSSVSSMCYSRFASGRILNVRISVVRGSAIEFQGGNQFEAAIPSVLRYMHNIVSM